MSNKARDSSYAGVFTTLLFCWGGGSGSRIKFQKG